MARTKSAHARKQTNPGALPKNCQGTKQFILLVFIYYCEMSGPSGGAEHLARIHGTEEDKVNCPFYYKIGACRHGKSLFLNQF